MVTFTGDNPGKAKTTTAQLARFRSSQYKTPEPSNAVVIQTYCNI